MTTATWLKVMKSLATNALLIGLTILLFNVVLWMITAMLNGYGTAMAELAVYSGELYTIINILTSIFSLGLAGFFITIGTLLHLTVRNLKTAEAA
ncbi:MAG: hypothetical protein Q4D73_06915 [Actinomycetaceae bacterium]|nr:hypothetical protein [Actinomycetaceae bacterium]